MADVEEDLVDELLGMAKDPESFSKPRMGEAILVAATEIMKLRQQRWDLRATTHEKRTGMLGRVPIGENI
jgi:hypothetical protein